MNTNPHPIGCFARLQAARACLQKRQRTAATPAPKGCNGCCVRVPDVVWNALECVYPRFALEGPNCRQALALLFAPVMAEQGWRFCSCYATRLDPYRPGSSRLAEHRFIFRLVDTEAANAQADAEVTL